MSQLILTGVQILMMGNNTLAGCLNVFKRLFSFVLLNRVQVNSIQASDIVTGASSVPALFS